MTPSKSLCFPEGGFNEPKNPATTANLALIVLFYREEGFPSRWIPAKQS